MNERPSIAEACGRVDETEHHEALRDYVGALAQNTMLETMYQLHGRTRYEPDDWRRGEMIRRVLMATPAASTKADSPVAAPVGNVPPSPMLVGVENAIEEAVGLKQAAQ